MPYTAPPLKAAVDAIAGLGRHISFHTADPQTDGRAEVVNSGGSTYARQPTTWQTDNTGGTKTGSKVAASGLPGSLTLTHWGLWSAVNGGTFLYGGQLTQANGTPVSETYGAPGGTQEWTPTLTVANPA